MAKVPENQIVTFFAAAWNGRKQTVEIEKDGIRLRDHLGENFINLTFKQWWMLQRSVMNFVHNTPQMGLGDYPRFSIGDGVYTKPIQSTRTGFYLDIRQYKYNDFYPSKSGVRLSMYGVKGLFNKFIEIDTIICKVGDTKVVMESVNNAMQILIDNVVKWCSVKLGTPGFYCEGCREGMGNFTAHLCMDMDVPREEIVRRIFQRLDKAEIQAAIHKEHGVAVDEITYQTVMKGFGELVIRKTLETSAEDNPPGVIVDGDLMVIPDIDLTTMF